MAEIIYTYFINPAHCFDLFLFKLELVFPQEVCSGGKLDLPVEDVEQRRQEHDDQAGFSGVRDRCETEIGKKIILEVLYFRAVKLETSRLECMAHFPQP